MPIAAGSSFGPYRILGPLGAGGMGQVYRARDTRLGRDVALKVLPPELADTPALRQRFEQEARAVAALNHPNILAIHDVGSHDGRLYLVSELVDGTSLRGASFPVRKAVEVAAQIADGLAAAHAAGIVHRDLKPENIMMTRDGRVKLLDFGLAKIAARPVETGEEDRTQTLAVTQPGVVMGTVGYMSPEQVRGHNIDHRSDLFSFGIVLHELLAGERPFRRPTMPETMAAILNDEPPDLPPGLPGALRQTVARCLEKEPGNRFQSARDLAFALRALSSSPGSGSVQAVAAKSGRRWLVPSLVALPALLAAAFGAMLLLQAEPDPLSSYRLTPLATDAEPEFGAAFSPDGRTIAYFKQIDQDFHLFVRDVRMSASSQLTRVPVAIMRPNTRSPFWSPDGSRIYYLSGTSLWSIGRAGGEPARVIDAILDATISPDGRTLAVWRVDETGGNVRGTVWISSPPGAPLRRYSPAPFDVPIRTSWNFLRFSPDGSKILLIANTPGGPQTWLLPFPDGGQTEPRRLFEGVREWPREFSWMPDSRHVVVSIGENSHLHAKLWLLDTHADRMRRLTAGTLAEREPSVSLDGRLAFTAAIEDYDLVELPLDGSAPRNLLATSRNEFAPSWSLDGSQFVYSTDRGGEREIWVRNTRAALDRAVVSPKDFPEGRTYLLTSPVFSPDGSRIAYVRYSVEDGTTVWISPASGGAPSKVTSEFAQCPTWSPDGNSIACLASKSKAWQPAIVKLGSDQPAAVVESAPSCQGPIEWSPAGDWIACDTAAGLFLASPDGKTSRKLGVVNAQGIAFSPDGNTIYIVGREEGRTRLMAVEVSSGKVRTMADYGPGFHPGAGPQFQFRLSLNPDGKSLTTSAVTYNSDLWMLEGLHLPRRWWLFR